MAKDKKKNLMKVKKEKSLVEKDQNGADGEITTKAENPQKNRFLAALRRAWRSVTKCVRPRTSSVTRADRAGDTVIQQNGCSAEPEILEENLIHIQVLVHGEDEPDKETDLAEKDVKQVEDEAGLHKDLPIEDEENVPVVEQPNTESDLVEVVPSKMKTPEEEDGTYHSEISTDVISEDQKAAVGFFVKDMQKTEEELAKKRAAFLRRQQERAEEAQLRKRQREAEAETKREELRRKAEEDRLRKEERESRRAFIQHRRRLQQNLKVEGKGRPKPNARPKNPSPKPIHREESYGDSGENCSSTVDCQEWTLHFASGTTTEDKSVHSEREPSHRVDSVETLPEANKRQSREQDSETASIASSKASVAVYSGPRLYKQQVSKSNKSIIYNALLHSCLPGKVNETQRKSTLDELQNCDSTHYVILLRKDGSQFRGLYSYDPETSEICKLTGVGPKSIGKKMIDKLYKYSSGRKAFTVLPAARTMSICVDALTIKNDLWQAKRPALPINNSLLK